MMRSVLDKVSVFLADPNGYNLFSRALGSSRACAVYARESDVN